MIWLITILLLAVFAGLGYLKGAIQIGISLVGLFLGLMLATPLASLMLPIYTVSGVTNLILLAILPPITAVALVGLIFMGVGIFVHFKVRKHFHYKTDVAQLMFKRLNQRIGAAFGLVGGVVCAIVIGVGLYGAGYLTYQVATDDDPGWLKFITDTRVAMDSSGLGKMVASLNPMPAKFYEVSDILGLAHKNPLLENRFRNYPPFLKLSNRADIQEIAGDSEFHSLLVEQSSIADIMKHPLGQKVLSNSELADILINQTDLKDLRTYLEDGESPIYGEEKILGRWQLNGNAFINHTKRTKIGIKSRKLRELKEMVDNYLDGASLMVFTDNSLTIDAPELPEPEREKPEDGFGDEQAAFNNPYEGMSTPSMSPEMAARYGLWPGQRHGGPVPAVAPKKKEPRTPRIQIDSDGSWKRTAPERYALELNNAEGHKLVKAWIRKNRLFIDIEGMDLVFSRVY
ncbi:MAG: hypothetical protein M2R45_05303 [Verrucomicrobia subdivision 3 bacterium]|nr:hypothetical protein [Limisphaerales bacterium]MCS1417818.1 hypothetical protein [Limisphaerales bacterium]